jgi:hypothetical protein
MAEIRRRYLIPLRLHECLSLVMAASPNQTKQNGGNQKRESHPLALKSMPLSLSLWQLVQTKPNKMAEIRPGFPIPLPLQDCLSLVRAASPNQTKQNGRNQKREYHHLVIKSSCYCS